MNPNEEKLDYSINYLNRLLESGYSKIYLGIYPELVKHKSNNLFKTNIREISIFQIDKCINPYSEVVTLNEIYKAWYEAVKNSDYSKKAHKKADSFWSNQVIVNQFIKWLKREERLKGFLI